MSCDGRCSGKSLSVVNQRVYQVLLTHQKMITIVLKVESMFRDDDTLTPGFELKGQTLKAQPPDIIVYPHRRRTMVWFLLGAVSSLLCFLFSIFILLLLIFVYHFRGVGAIFTALLMGRLGIVGIWPTRVIASSLFSREPMLSITNQGIRVGKLFGSFDNHTPERSQIPPDKSRGLTSEFHRNSAYFFKRAALASTLDTSGHSDKVPVAIQSCRITSVRIAILRAPTRSAWRV